LIAATSESKFPGWAASWAQYKRSPSEAKGGMLLQSIGGGSLVNNNTPETTHIPKNETILDHNNNQLKREPIRFWRFGKGGGVVVFSLCFWMSFWVCLFPGGIKSLRPRR
jgi:hypothetical protein